EDQQCVAVREGDRLGDGVQQGREVRMGRRGHIDRAYACDSGEIAGSLAGGSGRRSDPSFLLAAPGRSRSVMFPTTPDTWETPTRGKRRRMPWEPWTT